MLNKGIKLGYMATSGSTSSSTYTAIPGLIEYPDMGGGDEGVEKTSFDDTNITREAGLPDYGSLEFKFNDDSGTTKSGYEALLGSITEKKKWCLEIPVGDKFKTFEFTGGYNLIDYGGTPNGILQYGVQITVETSVTVGVDAATKMK